MSDQAAVRRNAFTVDVEDYYHVSSFESHVRRDEWENYESRVVRNTQRLLALMDRHQVHGTFFVLGWVAERCRAMVREIQAAGHEIGSHSYWHRLIYRLTPEEFRDDLVRSRDVLQEITGVPVRAFRAPSFSITQKSLWALEILAEEGFHVDSSIFPIHHDRYGIPGASPRIHRIDTTAGSLWEFPASVMRLGRVNVPISGGGYFRLYPISWTIRFLGQVNDKQRQPFVFYVHPWELDPDQPRLPTRSRLSRFRHYQNLATTHSKLERLLQTFRFGRLSDVVEEAAGEGEPAAAQPVRPVETPSETASTWKHDAPTGDS